MKIKLSADQKYAIAKVSIIVGVISVVILLIISIISGIGSLMNKYDNSEITRSHYGWLQTELKTCPDIKEEFSKLYSDGIISRNEKGDLLKQCAKLKIEKAMLGDYEN